MFQLSGFCCIGIPERSVGGRADEAFKGCVSVGLLVPHYLCFMFFRMAVYLRLYPL